MMNLLTWFWNMWSDLTGKETSICAIILWRLTKGIPYLSPVDDNFFSSPPPPPPPPLVSLSPTSSYSPSPPFPSPPHFPSSYPFPSPSPTHDFKESVIKATEKCCPTQMSQQKLKKAQILIKGWKSTEIEIKKSKYVFHL